MLRKERGSIAIMSIGTIILIVLVFGMAIDLSRIYNRKTELNAVAKAAALAAARELNGSGQGVDEAVAKASAVVASLRYHYGGRTFRWSDAALTFSRQPDANGSWIDRTTAKAAPAGVYYARVDTHELEDAGEVETIFMGMFSRANATARISDAAIAGRTSVRAIPMGLCAMGAAATERVNTGSSGTSRELVQYGFRRGISYDLMRLNPNGATPVHFAIDPFRAPGPPSGAARTAPEQLGPFVCTGVMWMPHVKGGPVGIAQDFPLSDLFEQLNSRFDQYEGEAGARCEPPGAPPDLNIMQFKFDLLPWMTVAPQGQGADESTEGGRLATKADLPDMPSGATAPQYGPLWNFAKAVPYSAYAANPVEPASGYTTFSTSDWGKLYKPAPTATSYPSSNPYMSGLASHTEQASQANRSRAERYRRVLNVPLLACPAAIGSTSGEVLAVAKFFMTVPSDGEHLYAEFAGIASEDWLRGKVELFP